MNSLRKLIQENPYSTLSTQVLRNSFLLPTWLGTTLIDQLTWPLNEQMDYIYKIENEHFKGALIMPGIAQSNDDDSAIERLKKADIVIFEIHGGAFVVGNCTMYISSFISWINFLKEKYQLDACVMTIEYGLAPMNKYPGPVNECVSAYTYLTQDLGVSPSRIIVSGDSAGGTLAIETLVNIYAPDIFKAKRPSLQIPLPAGLLLSSPFLSSDTSTESWIKYEKTDMVSKAANQVVSKRYFNFPNSKIEDIPALNLMKIEEFKRFMPKHVWVIFGKQEVFYDSIIEMFDKVKREGGIEVELIQEDLSHDWFMFPQVIDFKHRHIVKKYDELFVDFVVKAVKEASEC
ncbi:hypothetical protein G6F16_000212 [Rhizopus arrhizus]|uniref:Alpha/beta hydrolase fold-3 domain-containing protein n=1 Tax=Rhizopus oryzae TaxID=64495 RepID=A0A9P6X5U2_RHIOR|nr:hypothetical protein G6F23_008060 [Rhizopus arrhizus]KAG0757525.1 hypothetical protein G6F24_010424 [Rhizopus arrhizus]KAG0783676.1 hypothetical protein G6F21_010393 [Rhizopus arrhizus]KAG0799970.1 hypothetical protein G6F22_002700 [Rhizopus arrhizus]KAG0806942.1 hypothetical protein G6F20_010729 [Rhizopus arrhizus]